MATTDIYRVIVGFSQSSSGKGATTHIDVHPITAITPAPDIDVVGGLVKSWWNDTHSGGTINAAKGYYDNSQSLVSVTLQRIKPFEPLVQEYTTGLPIAGAVADEAYDPSASVIVSLRTDYVGRRYRGRQYFPPFAESSITDGSLDSGPATGFLATVANLIGDFESDEMVWCVYSGVNDSARDVTEVDCDRRLRSQRRRQERTPSYVSQSI